MSGVFSGSLGFCRISAVSRTAACHKMVNRVRKKHVFELGLPRRPLQGLSQIALLVCSRSPAERSAVGLLQYQIGSLCTARRLSEKELPSRVGGRWQQVSRVVEDPLAGNFGLLLQRLHYMRSHGQNSF